MLLIDVNVLVYAFRGDAVDHDKYADWLAKQLLSPAAFGVADIALAGFLRVVTHPAIFDPPAPLDQALAFAAALRSATNYVAVTPGSRHWQIFTQLCQQSNARGNLIPDAYLAALALETGSEWITTDRDFARFPGLRWRHPLG